MKWYFDLLVRITANGDDEAIRLLINSSVDQGHLILLPDREELMLCIYKLLQTSSASPCMASVSTPKLTIHRLSVSRPCRVSFADFSRIPRHDFIGYMRKSVISETV
jgi:hypothetical protein